MNMKKIGMFGVAGAILAGCATQVSDSEIRARAEETFKTGFAGGNRVMAEKVERQDEAQAMCSRSGVLQKEVAARIESAQRATLRYPADGKLMGNWREGEKIAQDGWGLRFTDTSQPNRKNGGACYNCHQLDPKELSYGTLGPSLYQFGKIRGYTDEMRKYAYARIYNSQAFTACSSMPRFGHNKVLTEEQIKDVVALLMDPDSPVNK